MLADRIVEVRVKGLRSLEDVRLRLDGLTVLLGENGAGKSSLIEAFELLRKAASPSFIHNLGAHGSLALLLREGASLLELGVRIEGDEGPIEYAFAIAREGYQVVIAEESLDAGPSEGHDEPLQVIRRTRAYAKVFDQGKQELTVVPVDGGFTARRRPIHRFVPASSNGFLR